MKNRGELDRVIVEGRHQPIVTKEEFEKMQKLIEEKSPQMEKCRTNRGVYSDDLWRKKMRCQCGHAFAKTKWHSKKNFTTYTYKCYDQTRTGTVAARLGGGLAGVEQAKALRDKSIVEGQLKKEQGRYETLLDMRMNNEIPKEVFSRKQQEVEQRIKELEQQMMQYCDIKPATEADVNGKLESLRRLMEQFSMPEDGEFTESDIDKYVTGVRVYEDHFEWLLNLDTDTRGEPDDAGSPVYSRS